jgi:2-polyprenyl-6-hydroxyphenyl methylase/3-demethylubiquinone-9 3-methyltransferase
LGYVGLECIEIFIHAMEPTFFMTTVNPEEIEKFSRIADEWWDPHGKFKPLHVINPVRLQYIQSHIPNLQSLSVLDIGCGGGLMCEPLAKMGANVTGIDASVKNISVAKLHAEKSGLAIDYRATTADQLTEPFDVVLALEIVEHVADVPAFVASVMARVKPNGLAVFSTINRTAKAYALAIVGAEYVLRWLPIGTHDWHKFLKPHELLAHVEAAGGTLKEMVGMVMNPLTFEWKIKPQDVSVNYLMVVQKPATLP